MAIGNVLLRLLRMKVSPMRSETAAGLPQEFPPAGANTPPRGSLNQQALVVLRKLGPDADRTGALFITVDPDRDTPAVLKDYLSNFDPHLRGLTGDQASIDAAIKAYRVYAKKVPLDGGDYTMDHTALVYLMDKDGRFVAPFDTKRSADAAAADLRRYL